MRSSDVFGMTPIVKAFSKWWTSLADFEVESQSFHATHLTYCTKETLAEPKASLPFGHVVRRGLIPDISDIARVGKAFADNSLCKRSCVLVSSPY